MSHQSDLLDTDATESLIAGFLPDLIERRVAFRQLVASADHARSVAPEAWGVTLYRDLFRLNVGRAEVLVVGNGFIRLNCMGNVGTPPLTGSRFEQQSYQSVADSHCAFVGPINEFSAMQANLQRPHQDFIAKVGLTRSGEPVSGSPHKRSHSELLMEYARKFSEQSPLQFISPEELPSISPMIEGAVCQITVNAYERSSAARASCIAARGTCCCVCGFDFGAVYGPVMAGYTHVHHIRPLSEIGSAYVVDPVRDLRPVCPNCHAAIHHGGVLRSIEDVQKLMAKQRCVEPGEAAIGEA